MSVIILCDSYWLRLAIFSFQRPTRPTKYLRKVTDSRHSCQIKYRPCKWRLLSPKRPHRLWDPPKVPSNRHPRGCFCAGERWWGVSLTAHLHLVSRLRMSGAIIPFPLYAFLVLDSENFTLTLTLLGPSKHNYFCILPMTEAETFSDLKYFVFFY